MLRWAWGGQSHWSRARTLVEERRDSEGTTEEIGVDASAGLGAARLSLAAAVFWRRFVLLCVVVKVAEADDDNAKLSKTVPIRMKEITTL